MCARTRRLRPIDFASQPNMATLDAQLNLGGCYHTSEGVANDDAVACLTALTSRSIRATPPRNAILACSMRTAEYWPMTRQPRAQVGRTGRRRCAMQSWCVVKETQGLASRPYRATLTRSSMWACATVAKVETAACLWLCKCAEQDDAEDQFILGRSFLEGRGERVVGALSRTWRSGASGFANMR